MLRIGRQDQHLKTVYRFRKPPLDAHYQIPGESNTHLKLMIGVQTGNTASTGQDSYVQVVLLAPSPRTPSDKQHDSTRSFWLNDNRDCSAFCVESCCILKWVAQGRNRSLAGGSWMPMRGMGIGDGGERGMINPESAELYLQLLQCVLSTQASHNTYIAVTGDVKTSQLAYKRTRRSRRRRS